MFIKIGNQILNLDQLTHAKLSPKNEKRGDLLQLFFPYNGNSNGEGQPLPDIVELEGTEAALVWVEIAKRSSQLS